MVRQTLRSKHLKTSITFCECADWKKKRIQIYGRPWTNFNWFWTKNEKKRGLTGLKECTGRSCGVFLGKTGLDQGFGFTLSIQVLHGRSSRAPCHFATSSLGTYQLIIEQMKHLGSHDPHQPLKMSSNAPESDKPKILTPSHHHTIASPKTDRKSVV